MSETLLEDLMQLFALLTDVRHVQVKEGRQKVEEFLSNQFSREYVYTFLARYDHYMQVAHKTDETEPQTADMREQQRQDNMAEMNRICTLINAELDLASKITLLTTLLNYIQKDRISLEEEQFVDQLADWLRIPGCDYWNLKTFALGSPKAIADKGKLLVINGRAERPHPDVKHIYISKFGVEVWVLHIEQTNTFVFRYKGERNLYLNGHKVEINRLYALEPGGVFNTSHVRAVYYGHVAEKFITKAETGRIIYKATDIEYKFSENNIGVHKFSFLGKSGQLVGIMGGSGTGKSTLINVLNGNYKLSNGSISINGYDLTRDKEMLKGVIGYVPQDDVLNEELTVYENLMFNARLVFSNKSKAEREALIEKALVEFDLVEARDLKVGNVLNKIISGGQRKRLNIALELMREPSVLFADEPTSGLSSIDSEKVMMLLKRQVLNGKLVIINIHQPNSDIYKLLDKLLIIDQGGRIVYNGNPMHAIVYFKRKAHYVNPEERECFTCGNVKTEQPLRIIEARMVDPSGKVIRKRKVPAEEWYKQYVDEFEASFDWKYKATEVKEKLPENLYNIPGRWSQFKTYLFRDALKKLKDTQYMLINIFEVPLLAFILAYATKYLTSMGEYRFDLNGNLPTFLFMSVVVAIFVGLNTSAEEIIRDRKLLKREEFLNLSRSSYLNSKIINLLFIAALQAFVLALIGCYVLEIKGMLMGFWLVLFSTFAWSTVFGLNISSGLKNQVSIYILIPLLLVPQLLFSGTMIGFDKLHPSISNRQYTPIIGDVMVSRWAYEALAVHQFTANEYQKNFFAAEVGRSAASYSQSAWIPELHKLNNECLALWKAKDPRLKQKQYLLQSEMSKLMNTRFKMIPSLVRPLFADGEGFDEDKHEKIKQVLQEQKQIASEHFDAYNRSIDSLSNEMKKDLGGAEAVVEFKHRYYNEALAALVLNKHSFGQITVYPDMMVRTKQPVFYVPDSHWGRAHFYAPSKRFANFTIPTLWFNIGFIWLFTVVLYITLYFDVLRRILTKVENARKMRMNRKLQRLHSRWT